MGKQIQTLIIVLLCIIMVQSACSSITFAEEYSHPDFYVRVSSSAGEINYRTGAGTSYGILGQISNGTTLYISDVAYNMKDQFLYGKTSYAGMSGWVSLRQTTILRGGSYGTPDFYVTVKADGNAINLRNGAGMTYSVIMDISNGTRLHVTDLVYNSADGFFWGYTYYNGFNGWISIRQTNIRRDYDTGGSNGTGNQTSSTGTWKQGSKGWWYQYAGGGYPANKWEKIGGKWYHFNSSGYMQTGWQKINGRWYYFKSSGEMQTGWLKSGGKWYYLNSDGDMVTGWKKISGFWYYFKSSGIMQTGWLKYGGKWYYLNSDGDMNTGWLRSGGAWYYMDKDGIMLTGWQKISKKWYYFKSSGIMVTGTQTINGKQYTFDSNGVWQEGTVNSEDLSQFLGHKITELISFVGDMRQVVTSDGIEFSNGIVIASSVNLDAYSNVRFISINGKCKYSIHNIYVGMSEADAINYADKNFTFLERSIYNHLDYSLSDGSKMSFHIEDGKVSMVNLFLN